MRTTIIMKYEASYAGDPVATGSVEEIEVVETVLQEAVLREVVKQFTRFLLAVGYSAKTILEGYKTEVKEME